MGKKYKSEILQIVHEDAAANFEIGAIDAAKMKEFDEMCLVNETPESPRPEYAPSVRPSKIYAAGR